jgi:hypothetical protein
MSDCSYDFFEAFSAGAGSYWATCACGRIYFASRQHGAFDQGEIDDLMQKAAADPDKYIDTGDEGISFVDLGVEYVHGCKCGAERKHEDWIWRHRRAIAQYIKARTAKELKAAQEQAESCASL